MPHAIRVAGEPVDFVDVLDVGRASGPLLRVRRLASDDLAVVATGDATRDGRAFDGVGLVEWGNGTLLRVGGVAVEIAWRASSAVGPAPDGARCRLCFGRIATGGAAVACGCCEATFHQACDAARVDCPGCGAPRETVAA